MIDRWDVRRRVSRFVAEAPPWLLVSFALALAWIVVRPWGNYSLNDDWTYAHMAKRFAALGKIEIDVPLAPNALGQALLGGIAVKLFGFSHTVLRVLTMIVGCLGLWGVDRIVSHATERRSLRLMTLLVLAFNPIYFYSATSYMNELYGWVPAILAAVVWFRSRKADARGDGALSLGAACAAGALAGSTFWTRQLCVLVYPALVGGLILSLVLLRRWSALLRSAVPLAAGLAVFGASIWAYFPWARHTGNFRPEFAVRIGNLSHFDGTTYRMQVGSALIYLTAFFLPLLILARWPRKHRWFWDVAALGLVGFALITKDLFETHGPSDFWIGPIWSHRVFPFIVNIVYNAGLGPITLDDAFFYDAPKASWPRWIWSSIEVLLIAASVLWSSLAAAFGRHVLDARDRVSGEVALFAACLTLGSLVAIVQAHQGEMVDRYYLPLILGCAVLLPAALSSAVARRIGTYDLVRFGSLLAPLALFSVLGAQDQFRWNDARWEMIRLAQASGGTRGTIQGGYELNCWNKYEGMTPEELRCEGGCRCAFNGFCCIDDRWRIGISVSPGYRQVASVKPNYWLAAGPPVILTRREAP